MHEVDDLLVLNGSESEAEISFSVLALQIDLILHPSSAEHLVLDSTANERLLRCYYSNGLSCSSDLSFVMYWEVFEWVALVFVLVVIVVVMT